MFAGFGYSVLRLLNDELTKPTVILEGGYGIKLNPFIRGKRFVYTTVFCKRGYYLGSYRKSDVADPVMDVNINIFDGKTIFFKSTLDGLVVKYYQRDLDSKELFDTGKLTHEKIRTTLGIEIKKVGLDNCFEFAGNEHTFFQKDYSGQYVFIFFRGKQLEVYDEQAKRLVFTQRTSNTKKRKDIERKSNAVKELHDSSKAADFTSEARDYMIGRWFSEPEFFSSKYGRQLLIQGSTRVKTQLGKEKENYRFPLKHYEEGVRKDFFYLRKSCKPDSKIRISWKGNYMVIYGPNGDFFSGHKMTYPGIITSQPRNIDQLVESIHVRNIEEKVDRIVVNNQTYFISQEELTGYLKIIHPKARKALMVHTGPDERILIELLVKGNHDVIRYPLNCYRVSKKR